MCLHAGQYGNLLLSLIMPSPMHRTVTRLTLLYTGFCHVRTTRGGGRIGPQLMIAQMAPVGGHLGNSNDWFIQNIEKSIS